jgi:hypothetical protein
MDAGTNFSHVAPPIFDGGSYDLWAVRIKINLLRGFRFLGSCRRRLQCSSTRRKSNHGSD